MIFKRERGIRSGSPKQDVLALAPTAYSKAGYDTKHPAIRTFYVYLGDRTLGRGTSARSAWKKALEILKREREREHETEKW